MFVMLNRSVGVVGIVSYKEIRATGPPKVGFEGYPPIPVSSALHIVHSAFRGEPESHEAR